MSYIFPFGSTKNHRPGAIFVANYFFLFWLKKMPPKRF